MSHSAPCSRRHSEPPYGLPSWKIEANAVVRPCCQPPAAAVAARNAVTFGWNRWVKKTTEATAGDSSAAATTRSASATVSASGLSSSRCRPAVAARTAMSAWMSGGSATATASHCSISVVDLGEGRHPVPLAQRGGPFRITPPHADQLRVAGGRAAPSPCVSIAQ